MMERGEKRTETDSRMVIQRSRYGSWEIMSFLKGVFSGLVLDSSIYMLLKDFPVHTMEAQTTTPDQWGRTQRVEIQAIKNHQPGLWHFWKQPSWYRVWELAFTRVSSFISTFKGKLGACHVQALCWVIGPPVPALGALILEEKPPHKQLWFKMIPV